MTVQPVTDHGQELAHSFSYFRSWANERLTR
jgi:hypothetical protein